MRLTAQDYDHLEHSFIPRALAQAAGIYRVDSYDGHQRMDRGSSDYISGLIYPYYAPETTNTVLGRLRVDSQARGGLMMTGGATPYHINPLVFFGFYCILIGTSSSSRRSGLQFSVC